MDDSIETRLVRAAQNGDCSAFSELVSNCEGRLFRLARHIVRDAADAEDVVQTAVLNAFEHIAQFRSDSPFSTWLLRITYHAALQCVRRRRGGIGLGDSAEDVPSEWVRSAEWPGSPEAHYSRRQLRQLLQRALEKLPLHLSMVVVLRDLEELSTAEVARALEITETNVKVRLFRARLRLRDAVATALCRGDAATPHRQATTPSEVFGRLLLETPRERRAVRRCAAQWLSALALQGSES